MTTHEYEARGAYPDMTSADPVLRRVRREMTRRLIRRARRERIAAKRAYLD